MSISRSLGALAVVAAATVCLTSARADDSSKQAALDQVPAAAIVNAGNGIYSVFVDDTSGRYTATTGPNHPAGPGLNVFFGNGSPGTTFNSYRSFTTNTDYVQGSLNAFAVTTPIGTTGYRTTYTLPGSPSTADKLTIVSDVNVNGTTLQDSSISVTTAIHNTGTASVNVGIRYLWDYKINLDDGPTFQALSPDGAVLTNEADFIPPGFVQYRIVDNDNSPTPPTFFVFGTATGPSVLTPKPTVPDRLSYVSWPFSVGTSFDYTINTSRNVANSGQGGNDSATLYYFGRDAQNAITIPAGGTTTVTALAFLSDQPTPPTGGGSNAGAPAIGLLGLGILTSALAALGVARTRR